MSKHRNSKPRGYGGDIGMSKHRKSGKTSVKKLFEEKL